MRIEQEYAKYLDTLTDKERKRYEQTCKIQRVVPVRIPRSSKIAQATLVPTAHGATNLYNYANFRIRNIFTGLHKRESKRYPNEIESIVWANAALERYRNNRIATLENKLAKLDGEADAADKRRDLRRQVEGIACDTLHVSGMLFFEFSYRVVVPCNGALRC